MACPPKWAESLQRRADTLLAAERTRISFAQLFDDTPIESVSLMMGALEASWNCPFYVTDGAYEFAGEWLDKQGGRDISSNINKSAIKILNSRLPDSDKIATLIYGVIRPFLRVVVREFCIERQLAGKGISGECFNQQLRGTRSAVDTAQSWTEEAIFGGVILPRHLRGQARPPFLFLRRAIGLTRPDDTATSGVFIILRCVRRRMEHRAFAFPASLDDVAFTFPCSTTRR